ncbi:MAG: D-Ala-D-Ala carboxypeptidase family metallohydrolase [Magnetococcus sp. DMHC-6]
MTGTPWPHFSKEELSCHCQCGRMEMDSDFMARLEELRVAYGKPMKLSSAYRCPTHNAKTSSTGTMGPHTTGKAVDIAVSGAEAYKLLVLALQHGFNGIGISQKGSHSTRFIHIDTLPNDPKHSRPALWSY